MEQLQPDGSRFIRRVIVERDGPRHAIAILSVDGLTLAHLVDNVALCVSTSNPGKVAMYSGAGFRAWFGLDKNGQPGYRTESVIPADGSFSRCDVGGLLAFLSGHVESRESLPAADAQLWRSKTGSVALIEFSGSKTTDSANPRSLSLRMQSGAMHQYGFCLAKEPRLSICKFSDSARDAGELQGRQIELSRDSDYPVELKDLCKGIDPTHRLTRQAADRFQRRFGRNCYCTAALARRDDVSQMCARYTTMSEARTPNAVTNGIAAILSRCERDGELDSVPGQTNERFHEHDPYVLAWYTEADFGPLVASNLRTTVLAIAGDSTIEIECRVRAFDILCRIGWLPSENRKIVSLWRTIRLIAPEKLDNCTERISWPLVEARL